MTKTITKETKRYKKDKHDISETQTEQWVKVKDRK